MKKTGTASSGTRVGELVEDARRAAYSKRTALRFGSLPLGEQMIYLAAYEAYLEERQRRALLN